MKSRISPAFINARAARPFPSALSGGNTDDRDRAELRSLRMQIALCVRFYLPLRRYYEPGRRSADVRLRPSWRALRRKHGAATHLDDAEAPMTQMPDPPAFLLRTPLKGPTMTAAPATPAAPKATRKPRRDIYTTTITITMPVDMKQPETVRAALDAAEKLTDLTYPVPEGSTVRVESAFGKLSAE
jgi:hypothetical protein